MKRFKDNRAGTAEIWAFAKKASGNFCIFYGAYRAQMCYGPSPNGSGWSWSLMVLPTPGQRLGGHFTPLEAK